MVKTKNPQLEQERRQHIMLAARRLLADGSHHQISLAKIAEEAGVSKGMLTYYFASKDELISATISYYLELQEMALAFVVEDTTLSVRERLQRLVSVALPDGALSRDQFNFVIEVWTFAKTRPEVQQMVREAYLRFRRQGERILEIGAREGYVTATDRAWVNVVLNALLDGLSLQLAMDPELDAADIRRRVLGLIDHIVTE